MEQEQIQKLSQLFNQFTQEEQASSFAVESLLNKTLRIINEKKASEHKKQQEVDD